MQISKDIQQEVMALLYQGYSTKSVCYAISKAHKGLELKQSDVLILAKKNNIKVGTRDITKEKVDMKTVSKAMPQILENEGIMKQVKSKVILIIICLLVLLGVLYFLTDLKVTLIVVGCILVLLGIGVLFSYIKFVKPNKNMKSYLKNKAKK